MSSVAADKLPQAEKEQLAVSYAAFILNGAGADVTSDSLNAVLKAANLAASASLVNAVAKALKGKSVTEFFGSAAGGEAPAPVAETKPVGKPAEKAAEKPKGKTEAPPPPPAAEEEELDMGGFFD